MALSGEQRADIMKTHAKHANDTGSASVQVALITARLNDLQQHFESHPKDHHSRRGLLKMVGQRRRLLDYVKQMDVQAYRGLIQELGIRK